MSLIVQKFGGTSVADTSKIQAAARRATELHQAGHQIVMVVSAPEKTGRIGRDWLQKLL